MSVRPESSFGNFDHTEATISVVLLKLRKAVTLSVPSAHSCTCPPVANVWLCDHFRIMIRGKRSKAILLAERRC
ncbi:hypothetical protein CEXT_326101 [Caerostris extrusa]|uniref:Uncharacterized protein n=1 Tax=Caerostris extrusa TaxID=172846 RepID=A0AAV4X3X8_CAEEX|nr:hypothetical protein CEXT_326101 [Caerostris extrusa]